MFHYTAGSLETIFKTGSLFEKSSACANNQASSTIRPSNNKFPVCRVVGVYEKSKNEQQLPKLSDTSHETSAIIDCSKSDNTISIGSVLLITEYSLEMRNIAFKESHFTDIENQLSLSSINSSVTIESNHILIIHGFQVIGTDLPLKPVLPVSFETSSELQLRSISSLRPHMLKAFIRFKARLTQKGK